MLAKIPETRHQQSFQILLVPTNLLQKNIFPKFIIQNIKMNIITRGTPMSLIDLREKIPIGMKLL